MGVDGFSPENYGSYESLPDEEKKNFAEVEGGFVRKEAKDLLVKAGDVAKEANSKRPLLQKVFSQGAVDAMDVLHENASFEFRDKIESLFEGVTSISGWQSLSKEDFDGMIDTVSDEVSREDPSMTKEKAIEFYKGKASRYADWLEGNISRPFFQGSEEEITSVVEKIRSIAA